MSFTVEKLEHSMAKLTITVPAADFDKAMTAAYNKTKNRFNVPGFRKGKVPMAFIEKMYGPEVFYEDAANAMINEYYPKEAVASELEIASQPVIDGAVCHHIYRSVGEGGEPYPSDCRNCDSGSVSAGSWTAVFSFAVTDHSVSGACGVEYETQISLR